MVLAGSQGMREKSHETVVLTQQHRYDNVRCVRFDHQEDAVVYSCKGLALYVARGKFCPPREGRSCQNDGIHCE